MNRIEPQVGEVVVLGDAFYKCIEKGGCAGCCFHNPCKPCVPIPFVCSPEDRRDGRSVQFRWAGSAHDALPDSGQRREFSTGSVRDVDTDKPRPDLISPWVLGRFGRHLRKGAEKYNPWNWALGQPSSEYFASLQRHLMKYAQGETDEDHLSAAMFNIMGLIHNEELCGEPIEIEYKPREFHELPASLLDFPKFRRKPEGEAEAAEGNLIHWQGKKYRKVPGSCRQCPLVKDACPTNDHGMPVCGPVGSCLEEVPDA